MAALLGIDFGTTGFKVQLFDERGVYLAGAGGELPVGSPASGWVEQDTDQAWAAVAGAIRNTVGQLADPPDSIGAVCSTGTFNLTMYDEAGRQLRPAILYGDTRLPPGTDVDTILKELGPQRIADHFGLEKLDEATQTIILRVLRSSKLLWMRAHEPDVWDRVHRILGSSWDLINFRLTGRFAHLADGMALERDIAGLFGIPGSAYGDVCGLGEVVGYVNQTAAADTGLPAGTPVVMGTTDSLCAFLGSGLVQPGWALNAAGTTDVIAVVTSGRARSKSGYPIAHLIPGLWLLSLSPVRGPILRWFRDNFLPVGAGYAEIDRIAKSVPAGADGLLCLPYFAGEKGVIHDPAARGILVGLHLGHGAGHIARALLEGIAFGLREILEAYGAAGYPATRLFLSGGGARSTFWNQMKADVLGRPVEVLRTSETGCLGAAALAGIALGAYESLKEAAVQMVQVEGVLEPDPARAEVYEHSYGLFRKLYPAAAPIFPGLGEIGVELSGG